MSTHPLCQEQTFSTIFRTYADTVFNFVYYKSGDKEQAKDITQEAFMKLWQNCASVTLESAKGYVFMTARNKMFNNFEHKKVQLKFANLNHSERTNENPEFILEVKELHQKIEEAISNLPEKQRIVFLLSRIDKLTYKEIAKILDISKQAVEKRIYNALDTMRKINKNIR